MGEYPYSYSGFQVVGAGDVDGDSYDDIMISNGNANPFGRKDAGIAYIIYGQAENLGDINLATVGVCNPLMGSTCLNDICE